MPFEEAVATTTTQQPLQQQTDAIKKESSSSFDKEIAQLRAELRVYFEHICHRLDEIRRLQ
jgi:hypothetical protein